MLRWKIYSREGAFGAEVVFAPQDSVAACTKFRLLDFLKPFASPFDLFPPLCFCGHLRLLLPTFLSYSCKFARATAVAANSIRRYACSAFDANTLLFLEATDDLVYALQHKTCDDVNHRGGAEMAKQDEAGAPLRVTMTIEATFAPQSELNFIRPITPPEKSINILLRQRSQFNVRHGANLLKVLEIAFDDLSDSDYLKDVNLPAGIVTNESKHRQIASGRINVFFNLRDLLQELIPLLND